MKGAAITLLVVLAMAQFMASPARAAISCGQVSAALAPCLTYLTQGGTPSGQCCTGAKNLQAMAQTKDDRQTACRCAKDAATRNQNIKDDAAAQLPQKCGVQTTIPISRNTDLSTKEEMSQSETYGVRGFGFSHPFNNILCS
ncbi:non-specific lipid-transfer protein 1-like [Cornus florida]|uniref:non-specific lipid-transfer protein 1-like n=1 Tax=Cornus florida TaxID=4283 RepID=UPI002899991F|nr:non-specific lipid-transfer protein 1-like [Cornus florida]